MHKYNTQNGTPKSVLEPDRKMYTLTLQELKESYMF